jgi:hypothetical protein
VECTSFPTIDCITAAAAAAGSHCHLFNLSDIQHRDGHLIVEEEGDDSTKIKLTGLVADLSLVQSIQILPPTNYFGHFFLNCSLSLPKSDQILDQTLIKIAILPVNDLPQLDISFLSLDHHHHQQQQQHTLSKTDSCTEDEDCILNLKIFDPDFSSLHSCDGQDWFVISIHSSSSPQEMISFEIINPFACHQYAALHENFVMKCSAASQQQGEGRGRGWR